MIENLTIITGSPAEAQEKAAAFLAAHPNARILGTAVTMKRGAPVETAEEPEPPKAKKPASKQAANAGRSEEDASKEPAATLKSVTYGPDEPVVAITLGLVFPH